jgi:SAM-dependent methyltransferase
MFELTLRVQGKSVRLRIPPDKVFVPNLVGLFSATQLRVRRGDVAADVSTGSGFHAVLAAKLGARRVYGVDINPSAVRAARANARLNGVGGKCEFRVGSVLSPWKGKAPFFDLVVSTLPNTRNAALGREASIRQAPRVSRFLKGGKDGADLSVRFVREAAALLKPGGRLHFHLVDWSNSGRVEDTLRAEGFRPVTLARSDIPVWGQRCNLRAAMADRGSAGRWTVRYSDFPRARGLTVRVLQAGRNGAASAAGRRAAAASLEWKGVPREWIGS